MDYIRNLNRVKCLVMISRVILLWNSGDMWKLKEASQMACFFEDLHGWRARFPQISADLLLAMLEIFHLPEAFLCFGLRLVWPAQVLFAVF